MLNSGGVVDVFTVIHLGGVDDVGAFVDLLRREHEQTIHAIFRVDNLARVRTPSALKAVATVNQFHALSVSLRVFHLNREYLVSPMQKINGNVFIVQHGNAVGALWIEPIHELNPLLTGFVLLKQFLGDVKTHDVFPPVWLAAFHP